jgi:hypothetical protein
MKHFIGLGIAMFAGAVVGAAAVGGLHAQTKPKAYQVTEQTVVDAAALPPMSQRYRQQSRLPAVTSLTPGERSFQSRDQRRLSV